MLILGPLLASIVQRQLLWSMLSVFVILGDMSCLSGFWMWCRLRRGMRGMSLASGLMLVLFSLMSMVDPRLCYLESEHPRTEFVQCIVLWFICRGLRMRLRVMQLNVLKMSVLIPLTLFRDSLEL